MKNYLSRARFAIDRAQFHPDDATVPQTLAKADEFIKLAAREWTTYLALPLDPDERQLAEKMGAKRDIYVDKGLRAVAAALLDKNPAKSDELILNQLGGQFVGFDEAWNQLQEYQMTLGKERYDASQSFYSRFRIGFGIAIVVTGLLIIITSILLLRAIMNPVSSALRHFDHIAEGNLSECIDAGRSDEMGALLKGLVRMQQQLSGTVPTVRAGSASIAQASGEISDGNLDLSTRTEQQAASLEETASSLEELTATVRQNADNARAANQLALSAADVAGEGGQLVSKVIETMRGIEQSSRRIVDIIAVIDGIAFQTNILALNAAVEAARAGEQGRGFAVVATEVRNLAHRAAGAAKEIKGLIELSVQQVETGTALVAKTGTTMENMVESVARVTQIMGDIMVAGEEQSAGINQINKAIAQMDAATQQNAALVEQAAAAAGALKEQAGTLDQMVGKFKLDSLPARRLVGIGHST